MNKLPLSEEEKTIDEWRRAAELVSQSLRFSMERSYLAASHDALWKSLRYIEGNSGNSPNTPAWLRLERIGITGADGAESALGLYRALASLHRPGRTRLLFLVHSDGKKHSVHLGVQSIDAVTSSQEIAEPAKAFIEANWPGTRLSSCISGTGGAEILNGALSGLKSRHVMTGVPTLLSRPNARRGHGLELLLEGLAGRPFAYLVIADPIPENQRDHAISAARDLIGALHVFSRVTLTRSVTTTLSQTELEEQTVTTGNTQGRSENFSQPEYSTAKDVLQMLAVLGFAVAPLMPVAGLLASLSGLAAEILPEDHTYSKGYTISQSSSTAIRNSKSTTTSSTKGASIAEEYINAHIEAANAQVRHLIQRIEGQSMWNVGAYLLTDRADEGKDAIYQLAALLNGSRNAREEPIRFHEIDPRVWTQGVNRDLEEGRRARFEMVSKRDGHLDRLEHPLGTNFAELSTPLNLEELSLLVCFPQREVAGIKARPVAPFSLNPARLDGPQITIGHVLRGEESTGLLMNVTPDSLTKNVLITGSIGSGKSTTGRQILRQLHRNGTPFLVIEPAKTEYVEWARRVNASLPPDSKGRIRIYMPGLGGERPADVEPLYLNPFHVVSPDNVVAHIERLKTLLTASLPMQESLPMLLESALYGIYHKNNWFFGAKEPQVPTLAQLLSTRGLANTENTTTPQRSAPLGFLVDIVRRKGYEEKVAMNFTAALVTRFEFLREGWKRQVFDHGSTTPLDQLFDHPVVINLSRLAQDRSLAAGLLLSFLHEWRQAQNDFAALSSSVNLRHLLVLEEAHCLLEPVRHLSAESMDPKGMVSQMFSELMSEMRAWGQGFMIVDQYPTRLIMDAVKNTNLKIVHRLPARDDQEMIAAAMSLNSTQARMIPHLLPGQAIAMGDMDDAPMMIKVESVEV